MIIRYSNGTTVEGVTLSRTENVMRVALSGHDDVLELFQVNGLWITEDCEPVQIDRPVRATHPIPLSETDCVCSPELAAWLVRLLEGHAEDELPEPPVRPWSAPGQELQPM